MDVRKGFLVQFHGSYGSGLGFMTIRDSETGSQDSVPCDNGATVRALEGCFGDVITPGHTASGAGYKEQEVYWSLDEMGMMLQAFTPVDEASDELIEAYEAEKAEA